MEPRIRYATTADGVSIAFWTLGEGVPLVYMAGGPWGHVELWDIPECLPPLVRATGAEVDARPLRRQGHRVVGARCIRPLA